MILDLFLILKACIFVCFVVWMVRHIWRARKDERKP